MMLRRLFRTLLAISAGILLASGKLPALTGAAGADLGHCRLIVIVDDTDWPRDAPLLRIELRDVAQSALEKGISVAVVPVGEQAASPVELRVAADAEALTHTLRFKPQPVHLHRALASALKELRFGPGDTVLLLSRFRPEHPEHGTHRGFVRADYHDLLASFDLLRPDNLHGAQLWVAFLDPLPKPPRGTPSDLRHRRSSALPQILRQLAEKPELCRRHFRELCLSYQAYLSWMVGVEVADRFETSLRILGRPADLTGVIREALWSSRCVTPAEVFGKITLGWNSGQLSPELAAAIRDRLDLEETVIDGYPRRIHYRDLKGLDQDAAERVDFFASFREEPEPFECRITLRSTAPSREWSCPPVRASSLTELATSATEELYLKLRLAIREILPPPEITLYPEILYHRNASPVPAPGYHIGFKGRTGNQIRGISREASDEHGLLAVRVPTVRGSLVVFESDRLEHLREVHQQPFDPLTHLVLERLKVVLPIQPLELLPGARGRGGQGYHFQILKRGQPYEYHRGLVEGAVRVFLPPGSYLLRGIPLDSRYLRWDSELVIQSDTLYQPGELDRVSQDYNEFVEDQFAALLRSDSAERSWSPSAVDRLLADFPRNANKMSNLPLDLEVQWENSPYVFHFLNRLLGQRWRQSESRQELTVALSLYKKFGGHHPLWALRRQRSPGFSDPQAEAERDRRLRDYLLLLWGCALAAEDERPRDALKRFLDYQAAIPGALLQVLLDDARVFLSQELGWQRFEPAWHPDNEELQKLLIERGML